MKKALLFSAVFSFGLLISSCNGMLGNILGTSDNEGVNETDSTGTGDSLYCPHHNGHHKGNDHDADDSTVVKDSSVRNHIILQKN